MARAPRIDRPGQWSHVMNRGLAKRPVFETERDMRAFEALIAREVHAGRVEVHAYAILLNHYHLLVRSPRGLLSDAMCVVQGKYARWFNRSRDRDGPLFRGRFLARSIDDDEYWATVVRYIDANPVEAGLVSRARDYPHCSAYWYARATGPRWMARRHIERYVVEACSAQSYEPGDYGEVFPLLEDDSRSWWVERRLERADSAGLDLVETSPEGLRARLLWNRENADGKTKHDPLVPPGPILSRIDEEQGDGRPAAWWPIKVGLLRTACGLSGVEISEELGLSPGAVSKAGRKHEHRLKEDPAYLELSTRLLRESLP